MADGGPFRSAVLKRRAYKLIRANPGQPFPRKSAAVHDCIFRRNGLRGQVRPISNEVLGRMLKAVHSAPSVGVLQPWNCVAVRDAWVKRQIRDATAVADEEASAIFPDERVHRYQP